PHGCMAWQSRDLKFTLFKPTTAPLGKSIVFENCDCVRSHDRSAFGLGLIEYELVQRVCSHADCLFVDRQLKTSKKRFIATGSTAATSIASFLCATRDE